MYSSEEHTQDVVDRSTDKSVFQQALGSALQLFRTEKAAPAFRTETSTAKMLQLSLDFACARASARLRDMQVTVEIPDQFVHPPVPNGGDSARVLLEEAVDGAYRDHRLTMEQARQLLGFGSRMHVDAFLQPHEVYDYSVEDLDQDMATLDRLFPVS